jgi:hypothetical protein
MFDARLIEETEALVQAGASASSRRLRAVGYDEALDLIAGAHRPRGGRAPHESAHAPAREAAAHVVPASRTRADRRAERRRPRSLARSLRRRTPRRRARG